MLLTELIDRLQELQDHLGDIPIPVATHRCCTGDTEPLNSVQLTVYDPQTQDWVYGAPAEEGSPLVIVVL